MIVRTPVIGIPNWDWKKEVAKYARKNPNIHILDISDFCYECARHLELLKIIEENEDRTVSEYYKYYVFNGKERKYILHKIEKFEQLFLSIKNKGWDGNKSIPVVTEDGCRIDGSHRLSILLYLGIKQVPINIFYYNFLFSREEEKNIKKQVREYREKVYKLYE